MAKFISTNKKYSGHISRKSQVWGFDLMIALVIFVVGMVLLFMYALNLSGEASSKLDSLNYDSNVISAFLLSEGSPYDWTQNNVVIPGILSDEKINQTKLENFYNLVSLDYNKTRKIFNTNYDFYVFFSDKIEISGGIDGIGKAGVNRTNIIQVEQPENIVKQTRFTIYNKTPIQLSIYVWEK
jgi:hypothetical protein